MKVCCSCTALFGLARRVGDDQLHLLAEHALGDLGRDLLDQRMAAVDVLDGELHALELVFALHRIGAGARHGRADGDASMPCEPAGQVPIGGLSLAPTANAGIEKAVGNIVPPASPAPTCNNVRRDNAPDSFVSDILVSSR